MIIKKKNTNEYLFTEDGFWVRNFTNPDAAYIDLNEELIKNEYSLFLDNEFYSRKRKLPYFNPIGVTEKIVIVSDGYRFAEKQSILSKLSYKDVAIIATNGALANWRLVGKKCPSELQRIINWYVVNNPYAESKKFLPIKHNYYPPCIASVRTHPCFIDGYKSGINLYCPVSNRFYAGLSQSELMIDDYRNPICAAIGLAYKMGVRKLLLFCCDDSFEEERPASVQLENGLWSYPQQLVSQNLIDANLYWLGRANISTANHSSGKKLQYTTYISEEQITEFFKDEE